ncbi:MAG: HEAT repeat domain-containing protein [Phycisphaerae bacterium]
MNTQRSWILAAAMTAMLPLAGRASTTDALIQKLGGEDEKARAEARHLLPRQGVDAVPRLIPLVMQEKDAVWRAAFNVLADFAAEVSVPGREADRAAVTASLMTLVAPERSNEIKLRGLRLLPLVVPAGYDIKAIVALLDDPDLRERAREALTEMGTPKARAALREHLKTADADFQCALLNALAQLKDEGSLAAVVELTRSNSAKVRAAAVRALSWTGDPSYLVIARTVVAAADDATKSDAMDAMLRLLNAVEAGGGNWQIAVETYLDLLKTPLCRESLLDTTAKDAALAGLGRMGDGTCVAPILAAIKDAENPNRANGIAALRAMRGVDVTREIVAAYPKLSPDFQVALLPVLGDRRHPLVMPILVEAARSKEPAVRVAALAAMGEAGQPEGLEPLALAARSGSGEEKAAAAKAVVVLAEALKADGKHRKEAGQAYLVGLGTAADANARRAALEGLAACPIPDACDAVKAAAADKDLREPAIHALVAIGGTLAAAGQKNKAIDAYETAAKLDPPKAIRETILRKMAALGARVDLPAGPGVVTSWWIVGPFDLGENHSGWDRNYIGEPNVDLAGRYMSGKRRLDWKHVVSTDPDGRIDLRATLADSDRCIGYAYTEITVKKATDAVLRLGVDDSEKVYVNGKKVFDQFVARGLQVDQDKVPVRLEAGTNRILLKIWQNTLGWEFCMRITTPNGKPLEFTQKTE